MDRSFAQDAQKARFGGDGEEASVGSDGEDTEEAVKEDEVS